MFVRHVDGGSSNIIEAELKSLVGPAYNLSGYGIRFVASPSHADVLLLTGPLTRNMLTPVRAAFAVMPAPKAIITVGDWIRAHDDDVPSDPERHQLAAAFDGSYATMQVPDDMCRAIVAHVAGDPPPPMKIIEALVDVARMRSRRQGPYAMKSGGLAT